MTVTRRDDDLGYLKACMGSDLDTVVVFNLLRTYSHLVPFIDADLRKQELTGAQFNVLLALRAAGEEGLLMGEIGQRLVVAKSNVTGLIDRLESQGLVVRAEHHDRRATAVRLTDAARALLSRTVPRLTGVLAELTGSLDTAEKKSLVALLTKLRCGLRERRKESRP